MIENKERWNFKTNPVRSTAFVVCAFIVPLLLVVGLGTLVDRAYSAPAKSADTSARSVTECEAYGRLDCHVGKRERRVARKLREGKIPGARASYDMRGLFTQPKKSRRILVNRIETALHASQGQSGSTMKAGCCTQAYARSLYMQMVTNPKCAAVGSKKRWNLEYDSVWCTMSNFPNTGDSQESISAREVKIYGTILVCGASISATVFSGGAAGVVTSSAIAAVGGCGLGLWSVW